MIPTAYNKSASRQGSSIHGQVIAPVRGAACTHMNWNEIFDYDEVTGWLIWKPASEKRMPHSRVRNCWNSRHAGKMAGSLDNSEGYVKVFVAGSKRSAHRIIWEMKCGPIPSGFEIDHINGNRSDNRIINLRLATHAQNAINRKTNGKITGTSLRPSGRFQAHIRVSGVLVTLGTFDSREQAHEAYVNAAIKHYGEYTPKHLTND